MRKNIPDKITDIELEIEQLINQKTKLIQQQKEQDRKARTHRMCKRGGLVEKLLPDIITLTEKQFEMFVEKVMLTSYTSRVLAELTAQNAPPADTTPSNEADGVKRAS